MYLEGDCRCFIFGHKEYERIYADGERNLNISTWSIITQRLLSVSCISFYFIKHVRNPLEWGAIVCFEGKSLKFSATPFIHKKIIPIRWIVLREFDFDLYDDKKYVSSYRHNLHHRHKVREYVELSRLKVPLDTPSF